MLKELIIIEFLRSFLKLGDIKNGNKIYNFFKDIQSKNDFFSLYILNFLYKFVCAKNVSKRKSSAEYFEDLFSIIFNGVVADTQKRKNLNYKVPDFFTNAKDKIAGNKREKADIIFPSGYTLSLKTLIPENKEINMGSFEKQILFDGFGLESFLTERKNSSKIGLGSSSQFEKLLNVLITAKNDKIFYDRFMQMVKFIYGDDLLVAIKKDDKMVLNFFNQDEIFNAFNTFANGVNLAKIVNRYKGNSIRIFKDKLLEFCQRVVVLEFSRLNGSILDLINEFDLTLHKYYAEYFNGNKSVGEKACNDLKKLFLDFDERSKNT